MKKNLTLSMTLFSLLVTPLLHAQGSSQQPRLTPAPPPKTAESDEWRNWIFAASALVTVTAGVLFASANAGRGVGD